MICNAHIEILVYQPNRHKMLRTGTCVLHQLDQIKINEDV